jgi:hypothetical protein
VSLTLTTPAGATLACTGTTTTAAVAGVATFAGCSINLPGTYTLTATDGALTTAASTSVVVSVGPAAKLAFTTQPGNGTGGVPLATQPVVTVQDAGGNTLVGNTSSVTLAITTPAGATLLCTGNPKAAVAGVATFAGCSINLANTYTLTATDGALTAAQSDPFTITVGAAAKVGFTTQPVGSTGGAAFATQPVVAVQDAGGNTVTTDTSSVVLTITTPAGATLGCTGSTTKVAVAGVATFAGCSIDLAGSYTLTASDAALATAVSSSLTITVGTASKLAFTTQPSSAVGGVPFATQPVVKIQDAGGNTVTTNGTAVTLTITTPAGATLACTANPQGAVGGIATFAGCNINFVGTYTLTATDGALTTAVSSSLTITVGPAAKLVFTTPPSATATGGSAFATQPVVAVQDAAGNTVTGNTSDVLLTITTPAGAILTCTANPKTAVAGVSTFAACRIDKIGTYTLTASDGALTTAVSPDIVVSVGVAAKLAVTTQPGASTGGVDFPTQPVVTVQDAGGNTVTTNTSSVTLSITGSPGGAVLSCTSNPQSAVAGVATFAGCDINIAATYTLTAVDGALTAAVSGSFVISVGAAVKRAFILQPGGSNAGTPFPTQPIVAIQDAGGNTVTTNTSAVTLALTTAGGAVLTCSPNPQTAVSGSASFVGCQINLAGTYTLTATDGSLTAAISNDVTVV